MMNPQMMQFQMMSMMMQQMTQMLMSNIEAMGMIGSILVQILGGTGYGLQRFVESLKPFPKEGWPMGHPRYGQQPPTPEEDKKRKRKLKALQVIFWLVVLFFVRRYIMSWTAGPKAITLSDSNMDMIYSQAAGQDDGMGGMGGMMGGMGGMGSMMG